MHGDCALGSITVGGSSAFNATATTAAQDYQASCPIAAISLQEDSSGKGINDLVDGKIQIANAELPIAQARQLAKTDLNATSIGIIPFVVIVHTAVVGIDSLTSTQLQKIYSGSVTNWKQLNGPDLPVKAVGVPRHPLVRVPRLNNLCWGLA
ncbi:hypothetical protein KDK_49720 [Dictyobacter kobayashii]|uniref:PBP domain-containing protein n=1 Tax=Dictyobacter kobayashii TaxID=2014872 RepID=A0A402AQ02_9CHLR|nr:hypothetical protein KDK_49720 [Dictyobacter kobayashii]